MRHHNHKDIKDGDVEPTAAGQTCALPSYTQECIGISSMWTSLRTMIRLTARYIQVSVVAQSRS